MISEISTDIELKMADLIDSRDINIIERFGRPTLGIFSNEDNPNKAAVAMAIILRERMENGGGSLPSPMVSSTYAVALQYAYIMGYLGHADTHWFKTAEDGYYFSYCEGRGGMWNEDYTLREVLFSRLE